MEKTIALHKILQNVERYNKQIEGLRNDAYGTHSRQGHHWRLRAMDAAEKAKLYWERELKNFGKGALLEVTGEHLVEKGNILVKQRFRLFMVGVKEEDVREYLRAQVENGTHRILLETIKLKELQTARLINF